MGQPPVRARKKPQGNEQENQLDEKFSGLEHEDQQNNCPQSHGHQRQIVGAEIAEKRFEFIDVHLVSSSSGAQSADTDPVLSGW